MKQTPRRVIGGGSEPNPSKPDSPIEPTDAADHDDHEEDESFDVDNRATPLGGSGDKGFNFFNFIFL